MNIVEKIIQQQAEISAIRRDIHAHPETAFEELRTSGLVASKLESWGIEVHRGLAKTGVVGKLTCGSGSGGRAIGLRADMDALPIQEKNNFGYKSKNAGRMHACGHDGHTAMLLGAAKYLAQRARAADVKWSTRACSKNFRWTRFSACTTGRASRPVSSPSCPAR